MESGPLGLTWKSEETVSCSRTSPGLMLIKARFVHLREKLFPCTSQSVSRGAAGSSVSSRLVSMSNFVS